MGIHILLHEIDRRFELRRLNYQVKEQRGPVFLAINAKGCIPTLQLPDGQVITEYPAISYYLARAYPEADLLPESIIDQTRALEIIEYACSSVQMRGFHRVWKSDRYDGDPDRVVERGLAIVEEGLAILNNSIPEKDFALGRFSIADAALFFIEWWYERRLGRAGRLPSNLSRHFHLMLDRASVQRMLQSEGLLAEAGGASR